MPWQQRQFVSAITLALFAAFAVTTTSRAVADADDDQGESFVGTWIGAAMVEVEPASVHRGRIVTGTSGIDHSSQNPIVPPALLVELKRGLRFLRPHRRL